MVMVIPRSQDDKSDDTQDDQEDWDDGGQNEDSRVVRVRLDRLRPVRLGKMVPHCVGPDFEPVKRTRLERSVAVPHLVVAVLRAHREVLDGGVGEGVVRIRDLKKM
jgi:hypothetical protein